MNFDSLVSHVINFYHQYPLVVAAITIVLLFVVYKKTKASLKFALLLLVLAAFFYAIGLFSDVFSTGAKNKDQMIQKTRKLID